MASSVMLINPRRKRSRRKKGTAVRRRRRRSHARARVHHNPRRRVHARRRSHVGRRRRSSGRRRRNPALLGGAMGTYTKAFGIVGGMAATNALAGWLASKVPVPAGTSPDLVRIGSKAAVGIGVPLLLKRFLPRGIGEAIAIGGAVTTLWDVYQTYVGPHLPANMHGLEVGTLNALEQGTLNDFEFATGDVPAGAGSAYGQGAY